MKNHRLIPSVLLAAGVAAVMAAANAADVPTKTSTSAQVTAEFVNPEKYTDFRDGVMENEKGRAHLVERFTEHVQKLGKMYLPAGQRLEVRFLNIDMAGDFEPWRGPNFDDIRIMKDLYPPRMEIEYRLFDAASGSVIREGKEKLSNMSYLMTVSPVGNSEPLRHDFEMLNAWMRREFRVSAN